MRAPVPLPHDLPTPSLENRDGAISLENCKALYLAPALIRIQMARTRLTVADLKVLQRKLDIPQYTLLNWLNISTATLYRRLHDKGRLSSSESERVIGLAKLTGQWETKFAHALPLASQSSPRGFSMWLQRSNSELSGDCPGDYLDTMEGHALLATLVKRTSITLIAKLFNQAEAASPMGRSREACP